MKIAEASALTGVPVSSIRFYEKRKIIPKPARDGRDRVFGRSDIRAIEFVRDAQVLGLSLHQISSLLDAPWNGAEMAEMARTQRRAIQEKIASLRRIDSVLQVLETCGCESYKDCEISTQPEAAKPSPSSCCAKTACA